ncbi:hypothetical protein [Streptomyces sp. NPDC059092]|uniref:hypothetical protein n=1 Tax=Streptomyces sp. NPDC059092 TaxID=3346725 RepID=UPI0036C304A0
MTDATTSHPGNEAEFITRQNLETRLANFKTALEGESSGIVQSWAESRGLPEVSWSESHQDVYFSTQWVKFDLEPLAFTPSGITFMGKDILKTEDFYSYLGDKFGEYRQRSQDAQPARPEGRQSSNSSPRSPESMLAQIEGDIQRRGVALRQAERMARNVQGEQRRIFESMANVRRNELRGLEAGLTAVSRELAD